MMLESSDFAGTPRLDYEAWRDLTRSAYWGDPEVSKPNAFAGWKRYLSVCGFPVAATKIRCGQDFGYDTLRVERTQREVRRAGVGDYRALFQLSGRSAWIQNDQAVELAGNGAVLVDMNRPLTIFSNGNVQWLSLQLPRQPLVSHLGFEPQGGVYARRNACDSPALPDSPGRRRR
jgi:AraC family transcriptional regulator, positive regulator of tynA and feaB